MKNLLILFFFPFITGSVLASDALDGLSAHNKEDYTSAIRIFKKCAGENDPSCQAMLGFMYNHGQGVEKDYGEAARLYTLAAAEGNSLAEVKLAHLYKFGWGVQKDVNFAVSLYKRAASRDPEAALSLGLMYLNGDDVLQDYSEAMIWLKLAAEQGDSYAQSRIGSMYFRGEGVTMDYANASYWFKLAAEQGDSWSHLHLGILSERGIATLQDKVKAHMWYNLAAAGGQKIGAEKRNEVARGMTNQQIVDAQRMARECMERSFKNCN
jgi:TPR repeat protein